MDGLTVGRIVHYVLSGEDCQKINRRRVDPAYIRMLISLGQWIAGTQAHVGSEVFPGDHIPAVVTRLVNGASIVGLKCLLDGNDDYWVPAAEFALSANQAVPDPIELIAHWHWIEPA